MKNFKGAIANKCQGIEFDVWLTSDYVPVVIHGGPNGELSEFNRPKDFVWMMTHQQLLKLKLGEGEKVTTLEEVLMLTLDDSKLLINIEIKSPADPAHYAAYEMAQYDVCK